MPQITTITEYTRGRKVFPVGTKINVTWELAAELAEAGICEPITKPGTKKTKKKTKKIEKDGSDR
jgi:hypothetical protein|tara:strand:- start:1259 stop:1453 length:195 start_codon:yes stop_codon:yes gene_type:complete